MGAADGETAIPEDLGNINVTTEYTPYESSYIEGASVILEAVPSKTDSHFLYWVYGDGSDVSEKGNIYSASAKLNVIVDRDLYLTAIFQMQI